MRGEGKFKLINSASSRTIQTGGFGIKMSFWYRVNTKNPKTITKPS
jgi:hypothetical protein